MVDGLCQFGPSICLHPTIGQIERTKPASNSSVMVNQDFRLGRGVGREKQKCHSFIYHECTVQCTFKYSFLF